MNMIEILTGRLVEQNTYWLAKQLISDMEKQIADLKFQLSEKAIELQ
jgi:molybdopterin-biosynthesis enzyme MoeA-like protein